MPKLMSQKCAYGLRILLELTGRQGEGPVSVSQIAASQAIPQRFLELIVKELREGGMVYSHRGAHGGYTLAKDPEKLRVGTIIRLLDGPLNPMDCKPCGGHRECELDGTCVFSDLWMEAEKVLGGLYDSVTFGDLHRRGNGNGDVAHSLRAAKHR